MISRLLRANGWTAVGLALALGGPLVLASRPLQGVYEQAGGGASAFAGALLFVASDSALAWNRFRGGFAGAQALILGTYFPAQLLIALST